MNRVFFLSSKSSLIFVLFCSLVCLLTFLINWLLITDDVYFNTFTEQLSYDRINDLKDLANKWQWITFPVNLLFYFLKFFLVAICLSIGVFLLRLEFGFKSLFKIALLAEFIFLLPVLIKLFWFSFINVDYTLHDLQFFSPLSAVNLVDRSALEPWFVYPLSLINLFEVAYIITLSYFLAKILELSFMQSLKLVVISYGTGLLIWVIFITFLTVSLSA